MDDRVSDASPSSPSSEIPISGCSLIVQGICTTLQLFVPKYAQNHVANYQAIAENKAAIAVCETAIENIENTAPKNKQALLFIQAQCVRLKALDVKLRAQAADLTAQAADLAGEKLRIKKSFYQFDPKFQEILSIFQEPSSTFVEFITKFNGYFLKHPTPFTRKYGPLALFFSNFTLGVKPDIPFATPKVPCFVEIKKPQKKIKNEADLQKPKNEADLKKFENEADLQESLVTAINELPICTKFPSLEVESDKGKLDTLLSKFITFKSGSTHYFDYPNEFLICGEYRIIRNTSDIIIIVNGFIRIIIELKMKYHLLNNASKMADLLCSLYPAAHIASCHLNPATPPKDNALPMEDSIDHLPVFTIAFDACGFILPQKHTLQSWPKPIPFLETHNRDFFLTKSGPKIIRELIQVPPEKTFTQVVNDMLNQIAKENPINRIPRSLDISTCHAFAPSRDKNDSKPAERSANNKNSVYRKANPQVPLLPQTYQIRFHSSQKSTDNNVPSPQNPTDNKKPHIFTLKLDKSTTFHAKKCARLSHYQEEDITNFHVSNSNRCDVFMGWISNERGETLADNYALKFKIMEEERKKYFGNSVNSLRNDFLPPTNKQPQLTHLSPLAALKSTEQFFQGFLPALIDPNNDNVQFQFALQPPYFPTTEAKNAFLFLLNSNLKGDTNTNIYQIHLSKYIEPSPVPTLSDKSQPKPVTMFKDIINTLKNIHDYGYLHFDIRPPNVIYSNGQFYLIDADYLIHQETVKEDTGYTSTPENTNDILTIILLSDIKRKADLPPIYLRFIDWIALFQSILIIFPGEITIKIPNQDPCEKYTTFTISETSPSETIPLQFMNYGDRFQDLEKAILTQNWSWAPLSKAPVVPVLPDLIPQTPTLPDLIPQTPALPVTPATSVAPVPYTSYCSLS